jgi:hypothetical protein
MTTYDDLLEYQFLGREAGTRNVGWLGPDREFEQAKPIAEVLDKVWHFCSMPARGPSARISSVRILFGCGS